jgi:hypothetical protein
MFSDAILLHNFREANSGRPIISLLEHNLVNLFDHIELTLKNLTVAH